MPTGPPRVAPIPRPLVEVLTRVEAVRGGIVVTRDLEDDERRTLAAAVGAAGCGS